MENQILSKFTHRFIPSYRSVLSSIVPLSLALSLGTTVEARQERRQSQDSTQSSACVRHNQGDVEVEGCVELNVQSGGEQRRGPADDGFEREAPRTPRRQRGLIPICHFAQTRDYGNVLYAGSPENPDARLLQQRRRESLLDLFTRGVETGHCQLNPETRCDLTKYGRPGNLATEASIDGLVVHRHERRMLPNMTELELRISGETYSEIQRSVSDQLSRICGIMCSSYPYSSNEELRQGSCWRN